MQELSRAQRLLVSAGLLCLVAGAAASIWHFFASQSPSSPFHVAFLPGPVRRLAFWALAHGLLLCVLAFVLPHATGDAALQRRLANGLSFGTVLELLGLGLGAAWGAYGIQIVDPRPKPVIVMSVRIVGEIVVLLMLVWLTAIWLRRRQPG